MIKIVCPKCGSYIITNYGEGSCISCGTDPNVKLIYPVPEDLRDKKKTKRKYSSVFR